MNQQNVYYKKIERLIKANAEIRNPTKVYFIKGLKFEVDTHERILQALGNGTINDFLLSQQYDIQGDNVELYVVEKNELFFMLLILDYAELLSGETVLDLLKISSSIFDLKNHELIFSS